MLKTATLTWNSFYNYGTCLQAYALQHYIESLGYENHIIDDCTIVSAVSKSGNRHGVGNKWKRRWRKAWQSVHANYRAFFRCQQLLYRGIDEFKANTLKIDHDTASVLKDEKDYDVYICGSDQIWNPKVLTDNRRLFYYAAFTQKKKISYAPSIGSYQILDEWKSKIAELISSFSAISIREEAGREALQELTQQKVELAVDPTLLLDKKEWENVLPCKIDKKEKYILGYILTPNKTHYQISKDYAHRHGLNFYLFMSNLQDYGKADKLISGGPFDFLEYIRNADLVFTDSFHGTIFSAIFETPFYTFKRFTDDSPINQNSRIETLLKNMGAEDRIIDGKSPLSLSNDAPQFSEIKHRLEPFITHSKEFLRANLSSIERCKG
jgi:hypothetical protein